MVDELLIPAAFLGEFIGYSIDYAGSPFEEMHALLGSSANYFDLMYRLQNKKPVLGNVVLSPKPTVNREDDLLQVYGYD